MPLDLWPVVGEIGLLTTVLIPLGILLHVARQSDAQDPTPQGLRHDVAAEWQRGSLRQIRRQRIASGGTTMAAVMSIEAISRMGFDSWVAYLAPVLAALVLIVLFLSQPATAPPTCEESQRHIDLGSRHVWSFGRRWWFVAWILVVAALVITVVFAGFASGVDSEGNYSVIVIGVGGGTASSSFLGWFYGAPILIVVAGLAAGTVFSLWRGARPSLAATPGERLVDVWLRRTRTRAVLAIGGGAIILTLALALKFIGAGARLAGGVPASSVGDIRLGTPIAALSFPLSLGGLLLEGLGVAVMLLPLLARMPRIEASTATIDLPGVNRQPASSRAGAGTGQRHQQPRA